MKTTFLLWTALLGTTSTAQNTWYQVATGTHKKLNAIDFPSSKVGYIGGDDSTLLKSADGGKTWNAVTFTGIKFNIGGGNILDLDFVTDSTGYLVAGPYGGAYKTTNGGSTWTQLTTAGNLCFLETVYFFDALNGFIAGSSCFQGENIEKMTAGTLTPAIISSPSWMSSHRVTDMDFLNSNFGLAVSHGGNILRTTNGGANWDSIPSGQDEGTPLTSVAVMNTTLAYAGYNSPGTGFGLLRSDDGGLSWADDPNTASFFYPAFLCLHEATGGTLFCGAMPSSGNGGLIFENTSGNWTMSGVDHAINGMSSYSDVVFGVGDSGYVVVNKPLLNVGMADHSTTGSLLTVYPNPVRDRMYVQTPAETGTGNPTVHIYSASGTHVYVCAPGKNGEVDLSALSAGLYVAELTGSATRQYARIIKE